MEPNEMQKNMEAVARNMIGPLIDYEKDLNVEVSLTSQVAVITLEAAKSDIGKIIGKQGKNIDALRILLSAYANRFRFRCHVEINE
jgi:predicted RNA-binding protein YlqC (UPF0109 family)